LKKPIIMMDLSSSFLRYERMGKVVALVAELSAAHGARLWTLFRFLGSPASIGVELL
jgi:hypothetical protein